ncbi:MAG: hypothetical protein J6R82_03095 [Clostridia bacterium]|nr:hypothetical protein [Clostridia bacterium]
MWNKLKAFFWAPAEEEQAIATGEVQGAEVPVDPQKRRFDIFAKVMAVLVALGLWAYVVSTNTTFEERDFSLVAVTCQGEDALRTQHGLIVQSISIDTLNITVMGSRQQVRALTADQVKAYVSLSDIQTADEYQRTVYVDVPSGITVVSQSVQQVVVSVDSPAVREYPITSVNLSMRGWSLAEGCFFGETSLNIDKLTLEGPTRALEKVANIQLRTDVIGAATGTFTVTATPYLLDGEGNVLTDNRITIQEKNLVEARIEVLKSKTVPLTVVGQHGYLTADQVKITPESVVITGDPQAVDSVDTLLLGEVDETALKGDESKTFTIAAEGFTVTDAEGASVTAAEAKFYFSDLPTRTVENVIVWRGDHVVGTVNVTVRAVSQEAAAQMQALQAGQIAIYSDPNAPEGDTTSMTIVFSEFFRDAVYVIGLDGYQAGEPPIELEFPITGDPAVEEPDVDLPVTNIPDTYEYTVEEVA